MELRKKPRYLLALGAIVVASPFIIQQFMPISDWTDGIIRGFGIGLMLVALIASRKRKQAAGNAV